MRALLFRLEWDEQLRQQLEKVRLIFMPIVNAGDMWAHKRANPNGVDLMRNAPQRAESSVPFLAGGQTLTPLLPWYCGQPAAPMQIESAALLSVVSEQLSIRPFSHPAQRLRPRNWLTLASIALRWGAPAQAELVEQALHQVTCNQTSHRSADVAVWAGIRRSAPVSAANAARQLWAAAKFSYAGAAPRRPVLVLSSTEDRLVNPFCSSQLADAWQTPHHRHSGAGHDLPHDDGPWVCLQMTRWLKSGYLP